MLIHKMAQHVNNIFGCSHMMLLLLCFQCLIVFLNSIYRLINGKFKNIDSDLIAVSSTFTAFRVIIHLFYFNKETAECYKAVKLFETLIKLISIFVIDRIDFVLFIQYWNECISDAASLTIMVKSGCFSFRADYFNIDFPFCRSNQLYMN